jgi:mono/diheme cytochrome c family protein
MSLRRRFFHCTRAVNQTPAFALRLGPLLCLLLCSCSVSPLVALQTDEPTTTQQIVEPLESDSEPLESIAQQAVQLLQNKCVSCHGAETSENGLRLDSRDRMLKGGDNGPAMDTELSHSSLLWRSVAGLDKDLLMPPKNPLSPSELDIIDKWLRSGAIWPKQDSTTPSESARMSGTEAELLGDAWNDPRNPIVKIFAGQRLDLWSLKPVQRPELPEVNSVEKWAKSDLDVFAQAKFESLKIDLPKQADRHALVRRLCFDLTGFPPSPETALAFEADGNVERLVDQLLDSPQFGEHWARMWLDVARYSDSNGFDWDEFRPQAWRFRDYVIRSFNADKPFDQFVVEQLAGDELFSGKPLDAAQQDTLIATGFLRLGPHDNAARLFNEQDRSRDELLTDLVETTGSALLGITLSCCRCHDHKHDPFSQADHFRFRACFAGVKFIDDLPIDLADEQQQIEQHNADIESQISQFEREKQQILDAIAQRLQLDATASNNAEESNSEKSDNEKSDKQSRAKKLSGKELEKKLASSANEAEQQSLERIKQQIDQANKQKRSFTNAMLMVESTDEIPATFVLFQGDHKAPRAKVEPGVLSALNPNILRPASAVREGSSGRRLALAQWIASADNPLTARVYVNRVWQSLMGRGLVATPGDFGLAGAKPDDLELLDWLARKFIDQGWSTKQLIRMITLSATYQQAAQYAEPKSGLAHVSRGPRRLTAEQLRDAMLAVSGLLTNKNSGPPEWPDLPRDVLDANPAFLDDNETKTKGWYPSPAEQQHCRSIFLVQKRNTRVPILETFDQPDNSVPCTRRLSSVVAPQALTLLNGTEAVKAARRFAERLTTADAANLSEVDRIRAAFQLALQRNPTENELQACQALVRQANWTELSRVLINTNEFAYID